MTDLRGFECTKDTPDEKVWVWNGYVIEWEPLPDNEEWGEEWEYLLTYNGLSERSTCCGFPSLQEAVDYAIRDDKNYTYLETFGGSVSYFDAKLNAWVTRQR